MREKTCLILLGSDPNEVLDLGERLGAAGLTLPKSRRRRVRPAQASTLGSEKLAEINSLFTAALERRQDDWRFFDPSELSTSVISKFESEIRAAVAEDYENAQSIVLAFPCRSYYFSAYRGALHGLGYKTRFAFVFSSPSQATTSSKRDHPPVKAHRTLNLLQAQLEGEYLTRGEARIFLETNLGPHEPSEHVQKVASAFPDTIPQITARDKGAEEHRTLVDITSFDTVSGETLAFGVYAMLQRLEIDPADEVALRRLDEIRRQIDKAAETVGLAYFEVLDQLEFHSGAQAKTVSVALDGSEHSLAELNDSFRAAVTFLRKPYTNALRHRLSCVFAGLPFFSATRRARFQRSARKRDYKEIAARLRDVQFELARDPAKQEAVQFINSLVPKRRKVVSSDWHVAVLKALANPDVGRLPSLTISLVTFNSGRWLDGFFESLMRQNYPLAKLNVIFVDHGSTDDTLARINEFIEKNAPEFASIRSVERDNKGFGAGHDFAIRQSTDAFVLVSNVDLKFHPDTLSRLVAAAQEDEPDVASWEARQCPYEHPKYYDPVTLETSWSSHACILMRRAAYLDVGGYEDRIFMYGEDVELSYRYRGAGYRLRYLPQVSVTHFVSFDEPELRPHQLGGSISANILLRYRYGGMKSGRSGEALLRKNLETEPDKKRRNAFSLALEQIERDREHFATARTPDRDAHFPFNGFDYDITRFGHTVQLESNAPIPDAPIVSIITRTHGPNTAILCEAIASVLNQSYVNIEHLIVEDRTDFAQTLVESIRDDYGTNLRYIRSEKTGVAGRSIAGNAGLAAAKGDYLMFLDNDDLLFCDHVELLVRRLIANQDAVAAYSPAWNVPSFYSADGSYREDSPLLPDAHLLPYERKRLRRGNFIAIQSILFERSLYDRFGGFDTDIDQLEDWNLWARYSAAGNFEFVPKVTSLYRTPGDPELKLRREKIMRVAEASVFKKTFGQTTN